MNQIWPIGTEIWFRTDGRTEWTDGRTHGRRQNYIPPTSSGDNKIDWLTQTLRLDVLRNKAKTKDSCANTVQSLSLSLLSLSLSTFTTCYQSLQFRSRRSSGVPDQGQTCIPSYNLVRLCVRWSPHAERNISDMYLLSDACHGRIQRGDKGSGSPEKSQKYRVF